MKQLYKLLTPAFIFFLILLDGNTVYASSFINLLPAKTNSSNNNRVKYLKASEFVKLSAREYNDLTGKKLNLFQRLSFKITKMKIKHDLKRNPGLQITDYYRSSQEGSSFSLLWFILGLAAPVIGLFTGTILTWILVSIAPVIIAYATKQKKATINSAWWGFGTGILLLGILVLIVAYALEGAKFE